MPGAKVNVFGKKQKAVAAAAKRAGGGDAKAVVAAEPSRVPLARVQRAVKALTDFVTRERAARRKHSLLEEAEMISVVVTLFKTPERGSNKGIVIRIPHTLHPVDETRVCIFVKDDAVKPVKAKLEGQLSLGVDKVLSLTKLRTRFSDHQKRRELCGGYDLFLADDRILPMLTKALGREFFKHKKQPRPIRVLRQNLEAQIAAARDSTRLYLGWGNCSAVRAARTNMSAHEMAANIASVVRSVAQAVPQGWRGIQALHIKTPDSVALPLYSHAPEADALAAQAVEDEEQERALAEEGTGGGGAKRGAQKKQPKKKAAAKGGKKKKTKKKAEEEEEEAAAAVEDEGEGAREEQPEPTKKASPRKRRASSSSRKAAAAAEEEPVGADADAAAQQELEQVDEDGEEQEQEEEEAPKKKRGRATPAAKKGQAAKTPAKGKGKAAAAAAPKSTAKKGHKAKKTPAKAASAGGAKGKMSPRVTRSMRKKRGE